MRHCMATGTDRRAFIASAAAAAGSLALPARVFAQPLATDPRGQRILEVAQREVTRAGSARLPAAAAADAMNARLSVPVAIQCLMADSS